MLNPLDHEAVLANAMNPGRVVVAHGVAHTGGYGVGLAALVAEQPYFDPDGPLRRAAGLDAPLPCGQSLEGAAVPSVSAIATALLTGAERQDIR